MKYFILWAALLSSISVYAQSENADGKSQFLSFVNNYDPGGTLKEISRIQTLNNRFQAEVLKRTDANLDSLRHYGHLVIENFHSKNDYKGVIETHIGFGKSYLDKNVSDSSIHYFKQAIQESHILNDTDLLITAAVSYGWAQMWDPSTYDAGRENLIFARMLSEKSHDTITYLKVSSKLAQIYYYRSDYLSAFEICMDISKIAAQRKDTLSLIDNCYVLESIYSDLNLHERQMKMVHTALSFTPYITDSAILYTIYRTASRGYLIIHQYDSAIYYSRLNLPFAYREHKIPLGFTHIAKAYLESNQLDSARYYYDLIYENLSSNGLHIESDLYLDLGKIALKSHEFNKAATLFKQAESMTDRSPLSSQIDIYAALSDYFNSQNKYAEAFFYLEKYQFINDSLKTLQIAISVMEYGNALLSNENQLLFKSKTYQEELTSNQRQQKQIVIGSSALMLLFLGFGFNRFRKYQHLKSKESLTTERLRISRDLHDEVGATLSGIAMYSHLAKDQMRNAHLPAVKESLDIMQQSSGEMVGKLSDIVWLLNPEHDTLQKLVEKLDEYAQYMAAIKATKVHTAIDQSLGHIHLPVDNRRNIYLICKEAINNSIKYSNATLLEFNVRVIEKTIQFTIKDNGSGFHLEKVKKGNGLDNMQKRAREINASLKLDSSLQQGTHIVLSCHLIH